MSPFAPRKTTRQHLCHCSSQFDIFHICLNSDGSGTAKPATNHNPNSNISDFLSSHPLKKKVKIYVFRETFTKAYNSVHCELLLLDILQMFGSLEYTLLSFFPLSFLTLDEDFTKLNEEALKNNYKRTN